MAGVIEALNRNFDGLSFKPFAARQNLRLNTSLSLNSGITLMAGAGLLSCAGATCSRNYRVGKVEERD